MNQYDVIIIGAGLGGMLCGAILAKEGKRVAIIEQNKQVGGCLQTFSFDKKVFDSCVHYIGAMDEGQTQHRIFKYAGISDQLSLKKLDPDAFDKILIGDDANEYPLAQGMDNFIERLLPFFPGERHALNNYTHLLKTVGDAFPLYRLRMGDASEKDKVSGWVLQETLQQITGNPLLQAVLTGNNLLYASAPSSAPFYLHALISKSYIDSAYKCEGRSSQISKALWKAIQDAGGTIFRSEQVTAIKEQNGRIIRVETGRGNHYTGKDFIINIHPAQALALLQSDRIKPAYTQRIRQAANSVSALMLNMVLHPAMVPFSNSNIYWNRDTDTFKALQSRNLDDIDGYALYFTEDKEHPGFTESVSMLMYSDISLMDAWTCTHNRSASPSFRDGAYHDLKGMISEKMLQTLSYRFPQIAKNIRSCKLATPLTFRDYMGTADGSMYGIMTDVSFPEASRIPVRTRIENMFFTGQNVNLHGVLGVSITAVATCGELLGLDYILKKINAG